MALGFFSMPKFPSCYTTSTQKWLFQLDLLYNHFIILNSSTLSPRRRVLLMSNL